MKKIVLSTLTILTLVLCSCDNDELLQDNSIKLSEQVNLGNIRVLNGRIYFPNKITFEAYYEDIRSRKEDEIANI